MLIQIPTLSYLRIGLLCSIGGFMGAGCQHVERQSGVDSIPNSELVRLRGDNARLKLQIDDLETKVSLLEGRTTLQNQKYLKSDWAQTERKQPSIDIAQIRMNQSVSSQSHPIQKQSQDPISDRQNRHTEETSPASTEKTAKELYRVALKELKRHHWSQAEETLSELLDGHPASEEADDALHLKAYTFFQRGDTSKAYALWSTIPGRYPDSARILEGFYYMARIHEKAGELEDARWLYEQIVAAKSKSRHHQRARKSLASVERKLGAL